MRSWAGEYGRIIILAAVLGNLITFIYGRENNGFIGMLTNAAPESTVREDDNYDALEGLTKRAAPTLTVKMTGLEQGKVYDLLDEVRFQIQALNADGEKLTVRITELRDPEGENIVDEADVHNFIPEQRGIYHITYETEENYQGAFFRTASVNCKIAVD